MAVRMSQHFENCPGLFSFGLPAFQAGRTQRGCGPSVPTRAPDLGNNAVGWYLFSVTAGLWPAVESGILPPGLNAWISGRKRFFEAHGVGVRFFRRAGCPTLRQARRPPLRR